VAGGEQRREVSWQSFSSVSKKVLIVKGFKLSMNLNSTVSTKLESRWTLALHYVSPCWKLIKSKTNSTSVGQAYSLQIQRR